MTDYYTHTEENSAEDFDTKEIQGRIDKAIEWEMQFYEWLYFKGDEADRPERPGPHPDPKHEWNTNPSKFHNVADIDTDDDSDFF